MAQDDGSGPLAISSEIGDDQLVSVLCEALGVGHPEVNRGFGEGKRVTPLWLALKDASNPTPTPSLSPSPTPTPH